MDNNRKLIIEALISFEKNKSYSNLSLDSLLNNIDKTVRPFASVLFYGVIERKITLDYIISKNSKLPLKKLSPAVLNILRTAIYQLKYMDSVTNYAAVNEAVSLCHAFKNSYSAGFVNAVLRKIIREFNLDFNVIKDENERLEIEYSIPKELIKRWKNDYGEQITFGILKTSLEKPPVTLRVNILKACPKQVIDTMKKEGFPITATHDEACFFTESHIVNSTAYKNGLVYAQDISSQICGKTVAYFANKSKCETPVILDLCAAPGSKTFTTANCLEKTGHIFAYDIHPSRVQLISNAAKRLGYKTTSKNQNTEVFRGRPAASSENLNASSENFSVEAHHNISNEFIVNNDKSICNITVKIADAAVFDDSIPAADVVLCDLPCSGFGVIRRKPEIKYKSLTTIQELPALQLKILNNAARYVKKDGVLIYSTCTLLKSENEDVALKFLSENPSFALVKLPKFITDIFSGESFVTMFPGKINNDGFFIASFVKEI